ncbi:MAG TPA: glycosyltransferase family 2 protein [Gemmataceae bacterium]|nr:glycosyltransferase family 2 protein [Gemmataceae bacterium]
MTPVCLDKEVTGQPAAVPIPLAPFISVVVPVRNEVKFLGETLKQLLNQHYDPARFEVIVADGRSTDGTGSQVRNLQGKYPHLKLVDNPRGLASAGRNAGVQSACGEFVVIIDGHCEVDNPDYLSNLAEAFQQSGADCIGRPQPLDVAGATPLQRAIAAARSSRLGHNPDSYIYSSTEQFVKSKSVGVAYRRGVFDALGFFDEDFDACEDVEFNHRLDQSGLRCFFTPKIGVRYYPRSSLRGLFHQLCRYGQGRVRLLAKHPDTFTVPCFIPAVFLLGVVAGPLAALLSPALAILYAGVMALYIFVVLSTSLAIACQ